jgi:phosphate transport system permease protein
MIEEKASPVSVLPPPATQARLRRWRGFKDRAMTFGMGSGGISVIIAILLIFFYLLYVVFPMFIPPHMEQRASYSMPAPESGATLHASIEEQNEVAVRFTDQGHAVFFKVDNGQVIKDTAMPLGKSASVTSFTHGRLEQGIVAFGMSNGSAVVLRHKYNVSYPDDKRLIAPEIEFPLGKKAIQIDKKRQPLLHLAIAYGEDETTIVAHTKDNRLLLSNFQKESTFLTEEDEASFERIDTVLPSVGNLFKILVDFEQRVIYAVETTGVITVIDIASKSEPRVIERKRVVTKDNKLSSLTFLAGGISLLIGTTDGIVQQWFPVKNEQYPDSTLTFIRKFEKSPGAITSIMTEQRRKGFVTVTDRGNVAIHHSTAHRTLINERITDKPITHVAYSPRADHILAEDSEGSLHHLFVENEHPDVSMAVLWDKIWYESYPEPSYTWQSSSASNDFEPKFSLIPLTFGTLKAAFYAMLFAIPLAIMGAIYTAYFMAPLMRSFVKPTIEIMEALPTVILGFLAGLWLAPTIENHLPGFFALLLILPPAILLFALLWQKLPRSIRKCVPDGWQAALLVPVLLIIGWIALTLSLPLEDWLFDGNMRSWLGNELGLDYDQRNSIVVGIAMGVAVIPTIFSIAEDAIFSVPKHLTNGSLALGATLWQTLSRVVILTASPGIFSAVMIGMGRAVGETMIVLMATGNTPVMDMSIFQGMRTLSANIAVEMPESEVASTHYRILFLAALVLFMFTFVVNTAAEIVRQRLRVKYSSL